MAKPNILFLSEKCMDELMNGPGSGMVPARDDGIDIFKFLLVTGMILAHGIQLLGVQEGACREFSRYVNLITFSGFFLAFGYVHAMRYMEGAVSWKRKLRTVLVPLGAYWASALAWAAFVEKDLSPVNLQRIVVLLDIKPYGEFLLGFSLASALFWCLRGLLARMSVLQLCLAILALLGASMVPWYKGVAKIFSGDLRELVDNYFGLFLGSPSRTLFPVIPYGVYFLLGMVLWKTRNTRRWWYWMGAGAMLPLQVYFVFSTRIPIRSRWMLSVGRHSWCPQASWGSRFSLS